MLHVLKLAAEDPDEMIVNLGFRIAEAVLSEHFGDIKDVFNDMTNCFVAFGRNKTNTTVSLKAIQDLHVLSGKLASGEVLPLPTPVPATNGVEGHLVIFSHEGAHLKNWWPLLTGIANLVNDERAAVRGQALETLCHMLRLHGAAFSSELWALVFKGVLIPIFDNVRHSGEEDEETDEWLQRTCFHALQQLVDLFVHFYPIVVGLLPDVLDLLSSCAKQERENLARIGVACFTRLCVSAGATMDANVWTSVLDTYTELFHETAPRELLQAEHMDAEAAKAEQLAASARQAASEAQDAVQEARRRLEQQHCAAAKQEGGNDAPNTAEAESELGRLGPPADHSVLCQCVVLHFVFGRRCRRCRCYLL